MIHYFIAIIAFLSTKTTIVTSQTLNTCQISKEVASKLHMDKEAIESASIDYGNIVHYNPKAVLYPTSIEDIQLLVKASYECDSPFGISIRGNGHSTRGQDMALNGVVIDMKYLRESRNGTGIRLFKEQNYVDVGGEQLWIDVLNATRNEGVAPRSWTDFLWLSVGGTLSNAGVSGQTFRFGPQISNVIEVDVITGKGELVTCSAENNSELFHAVLGGLGQFGIITRARIPLGASYDMVLWSRTIFSDFNVFTKVQEFIIRHFSATTQRNPVIYLEGQVLFDNGTPNLWENSFFPSEDLNSIIALTKQYGVLYCLELVVNFQDGTTHNFNEMLQKAMRKNGVVPEYSYGQNVTHFEFLTRVPNVVNKNETHPWLNLLIAKSNIKEFESKVFRDIVLTRNITTGPVIIYPVNRNKWDDRMSAPTPNEEIFYPMSLLYTGGENNWEDYDDQNKEIVDYLKKAGVKYKEYLQAFKTQEEWIHQFGSKWSIIEERKSEFDPKFILSPGQGIFNVNA